MLCEGHFWETPGVSKGKRTHTLWRLIGLYLAEYVADDNLMPWASECSPPLEFAEVEKAVLGLSEKHLARENGTTTQATQTPVFPEVFNASEHAREDSNL